MWPPPLLSCTRHGLGSALPARSVPQKNRGAGRYPARGAPAAGDKGNGEIYATRGHPGALEVSTLPRTPAPGGSAPSPSPTSRGTTAAPGPVLTQFSPAGWAQPPRLLGLLLRLTAARALRQPPAPPRYVTASRLPRRGGTGGHAAPATAATSRGQCTALFLEPAGQLGGVLGDRSPPTRWGARTLTGVSSSGVEMGEQSPFSLMPLPRSKSQIFTGETWGEGGRCGR